MAVMNADEFLIASLPVYRVGGSTGNRGGTATKMNLIFMRSVIASSADTIDPTNFLNNMVDEGLLDYEDATGKGGHHRVYSIGCTEQEFKTQIITRVISKLLKEYPRATRTVLQSI